MAIFRFHTAQTLRICRGGHDNQPGGEDPPVNSFIAYSLL